MRYVHSISIFNENILLHDYSCHSSDGVQDHKHSENVWFHNTGIGGTNTVNSKGWNIKTLGTIRKDLNHDKVV